MAEFCQTCGIPFSDSVTAELWNIYRRIDDGRAHREALTFTAADLDGRYDDPREEFEITSLAMERDMSARGLCVACGRPDLSGVSPDNVMSESDAREMAEMAAERAAEIAAGC